MIYFDKFRCVLLLRSGLQSLLFICCLFLFVPQIAISEPSSSIDETQQLLLLADTTNSTNFPELSEKIISQKQLLQLLAQSIQALDTDIEKTSSLLENQGKKIEDQSNEITSQNEVISAVDEQAKKGVQDSNNNRQSIIKNEEVLEQAFEKIEKNRLIINEIIQRLDPNIDNTKNNNQSIDEVIDNIRDSSKRIDSISLALNSTVQKTEVHREMLDKHEIFLKNNSSRFFEMLLKLNELEKSIADGLQSAKAAVSANAGEINTDDRGHSLSIFLPLLLCLLIPIATHIQCITPGDYSNSVNQFNPGQQPWVVVAWIGAAIGFYFFGMGITSNNPVYSITLLQQLPEEINSSRLSMLVSHLFVSGVICVVICSVVSSRVSLLGHLLISMFCSGFTYPLFIRLVDSGESFENQGWLSSVGFVSNGGVVEVALLAGTMGLILVGFLLKMQGSVIDKKYTPNIQQSTLSVLLFLVGWYGFILTVSRANVDIDRLMLATYISMTMACLSSVLTCRLFSHGRNWHQQLAGSLLTGLIAVSDLYAKVTMTQVVLVGLLAGCLHNFIVVKVLSYLGRSVELPINIALGGLLGSLTALFIVSERPLIHLLCLGVLLIIVTFTAVVLAWLISQWFLIKESEDD